MSELPEGWEERTSRSTGQIYYLNQFTKQSQWDRPTEPAQPAPTQVQVVLRIRIRDPVLFTPRIRDPDPGWSNGRIRIRDKTSRIRNTGYKHGLAFRDNYLSF
jgi:hypothetical protein